MTEVQGTEVIRLLRLITYLLSTLILSRFSSGKQDAMKDIMAGIEGSVPGKEPKK